MSEQEPAVDAWRCEECREWHPQATEVHEMLVMDIGPDIASGEVIEHVFFARRLRVCPDCRARIAGERVGYRPGGQP